MAATVKKNIVTEQEYNVDFNGAVRTHVHRATGLDPNGDPLFEAANHPDVEKYGQPHPFIPNCFVRNVRAVHPNNKDQRSALVYVTFASPQRGSSGTSISYSSTAYFAQTEIDLNGNQIIATFVPSSTADGGGATIQSVGEVRKPISNGVLRFEIELASPPDRTLTGSINSRDFQGGAAGTWFMRTIDWIQTGGIHRTIYEIVYDETGWEQVWIARDRMTGVTPVGITVSQTGRSGNGWVRPEVIRTADFTSLGLPVVFN